MRDESVDEPVERDALESVVLGVMVEPLPLGVVVVLVLGDVIVPDELGLVVVLGDDVVPDELGLVGMLGDVIVPDELGVVVVIGGVIVPEELGVDVELGEVDEPLVEEPLVELPVPVVLSVLGVAGVAVPAAAEAGCPGPGPLPAEPPVCAMVTPAVAIKTTAATAPAMGFNFFMPISPGVNE